MRSHDSGGGARSSRPVEFVVDPCMYEPCDSMSPVTSGVLTDGGQLDLRYHFYGPTCAEYWIALCQASGYGHRDLVSLIDANCRVLLETFTPRPGAITVVSLGPGDAEVDLRLLEHVEALSSVASYCCVDFSFDLLRRAVARVSCSDDLRTGFPIRAVCGDFRQLAMGSVRQTGSATLFTLTGYTLGNYDERELLERIRARMHAGDRLLVDVRLHHLKHWDGTRSLEDEERRALTAAYAQPLSNRFAFGPVEMATTATAADVAFGYEVCRGLTVVPGAVNVITYCTGLRTTLRLTGAPIERPRLNLGSTTLYQFERLRAWFPSVGLNVCWCGRWDPSGLFLLESA